MGIKLAKPSLLGHKLDEREFYWLVAVLLVLSLIVVHRILRSHLGPRLRGAARQPGRLGLHGRLGLPLQGLRLRDQRGLRRAGGLPLCVLRAVHLAQHLQLRADGAVPAGRSSWAAARRRIGALLGAAIIVLLPKLLDDIEMFRYVSVALAVLVLIGARWSLCSARSATPRRWRFPWWAASRWPAWPSVLETMTDWRLSIFGVIMLFVVYYLQDGIVGFVRKALQHAPARAAGRHGRRRRRGRCGVAFRRGQDGEDAQRRAAC
jgi:hypothetical protein